MGGVFGDCGRGAVLGEGRGRQVWGWGGGGFGVNDDNEVMDMETKCD